MDKTESNKYESLSLSPDMERYHRMMETFEDPALRAAARAYVFLRGKMDSRVWERAVSSSAKRYNLGIDDAWLVAGYLVGEVQTEKDIIEAKASDQA